MEIICLLLVFSVAAAAIGFLLIGERWWRLVRVSPAMAVASLADKPDRARDDYVLRGDAGI